MNRDKEQRIDKENEKKHETPRTKEGRTHERAGRTEKSEKKKRMMKKMRRRKKQRKKRKKLWRKERKRRGNVTEMQEKL